jgi:hypothetical protein
VAFTNLTADGAIGFNWATRVATQSHCDVIHTTSGEHFVAPRNCGLQPGRWFAYHYHKGDAPISIDGVIDFNPYVIDWITDLDSKQADGLEHILINLNEHSSNIVLWRRQLSEAEHAALVSGAFATISGVTTVAAGIAFIGDLMAGGIPWASGRVMVGSGMACGANLGALEGHAKRGDLCAQRINSAMGEMLDFGRQIDLPFCAPHQTPIIQTACTRVAQAFGWKDDQIAATQAGIANWLHADLRFTPA